jgi:membrane-bound serine protease (ClpP class)
VGPQALIGRIGEVRTPLAPEGQVQVAGELWSAGLEEGTAAVPVGGRVVVSSVEGLRLRVRGVDRPGSA